MIFYHDSPTGGLHKLKPFLSEHGKSYIYFAADPLVALLYAFKPVPKPFGLYPYGFDKDGRVVYSEYYENAFYELYHGKTGYLYPLIMRKIRPQSTVRMSARGRSRWIRSQSSRTCTLFTEGRSKRARFGSSRAEKFSKKKWVMLLTNCGRKLKSTT